MPIFGAFQSRIAHRSAPELARTLLRKLFVAARHRYLRRQDLRHGSFSPPSGAVLSPLLANIAPPNLALEQRELLQALTQNYLAHRFDVLGSGWVGVHYGMRARGFEDNVFEPQPAHAIDPAGQWAGQRVHRANAQVAARLWSLVDPGYVPIDWQIDFRSGFRWNESVWSGDIDPAGAPRGADIKLPWELARSQHLPLLALDYALRRHTENDVAQALWREFRNQILDFTALNPPRFGVNWVCTMDVAIRVANWVLAYDLFCGAGAPFDIAFCEAFRQSVHEHACHVLHELEWHERFRANHYLADIAGLLFASAHLRSDPQADVGLALALQELFDELLRQFDEDGAHFEASTAYHGLSAQIVIHAIALALAIPADRLLAAAQVPAQRFTSGVRLRRGASLTLGQSAQPHLPLPPNVVARLQQIGRFCLAITRHDGGVPQIGDNDSGQLFKMPEHFEFHDGSLRQRTLDLRPINDAMRVLGLDPADEARDAVCGADSWLIACLAAGTRIAPPRASARPIRRLGQRADLDRTLQYIWSLPSENQRKYRFAVPKPGLLEGVSGQAFPGFGLFVVRSPRLYLAVRCGRLSDQLQGAHAHQDQLAIELWIDGAPIVVDPGSYVYTPLPELRDRYRGVGAHFAPRLLDEPLKGLGAGLFVLQDVAQARVLYFGGDGFAGMHVGFGAPVYRAVLVQDDAICVFDGSDAGPLAELPVRSVPYSPGYGIIDL